MLNDVSLENSLKEVTTCADRREIQKRWKKSTEEFLTEYRRSAEQYGTIYLEEMGHQRLTPGVLGMSDDMTAEAIKNKRKLKKCFRIGTLTFTKKKNEESMVTVHAPILTEFGIFEGEVLPITQFMSSVLGSYWDTESTEVA